MSVVSSVAVMLAAACIYLLARPLYRLMRGDWIMLRQRRRMRFAGALVHRVVVPAGPGQRPGEEILSPSLPAHVSRMFDGHEARQDFGVMLGKRSILQAVCLGPSRPGDQADVFAARAIGNLQGSAGALIEEPS